MLRCEVCGLGVAQAGGSRDDAKAAAEDAARSGTPNRASFAAWIGGGAWAGLEPGRRYLLTPDAIGRLQPQADKPRSAPSIALMWQTLQNSFTFGRNLALSRSGRVIPTPAAKDWQRGLDRVIVVLTAIPLLLFAVLFEVPAAVAGRGGELKPR